MRTKSKRKLSSIRLTKRYNSRFMWGWILVSLAQVLVVALLMYQQHQQMWNDVMPRAADVPLESLQQQYSFFATLSLEIVIFIACIFALSLITTHRIAGPYIALKRVCNDIYKGKFNTRLNFRQYDDLKDVEECFNRMLDLLQRNLKTPVDRSEGVAEPCEDSEKEHSVTPAR